MKICSRCGVLKDLSEFGLRGSKRSDLQSYCKTCKRESDRIQNQNAKIEAFKHYGGVKCVCCGIAELAFLALDHEENDGAKHRKEAGGSGTRIYRWLKARKWPNLKLRVLCHNCNIGRQVNGGMCPHKSFNSAIV